MFDIDRAVFFSIIGKIWTLSAGLITTLLIASTFSGVVQGYYFTFTSVLAFQMFGELGLGVVLTYYASHEWANLAFDRHGRVIGDADALSRLTSLARFSLRWYIVGGGIMTLTLSVGGFIFFAMAKDQALQWEAPWIVLCLITGLNFCIAPIWSILEGCNQVGNLYTYRLIYAIAFSITSWVAIYSGAELWTSSISLAAGVLVTIALIGRRYGQFIRAIFLTQPKGPRLSWRMDVLPMQWRIALSWASGYLTFSLFTPVLFHYQGAVVAGQMGMTWAISNAVIGLASSWLAPKAPTFGILVAQRRYVELDRIFWRVFLAVLVVTVSGATAIWVLIFALNWLHHPLATRFLSPESTGCLLAATALVSISLPMSTYLRAHKKEPALILSVITGLLVAITVVVLAKYYSAAGVVIGYLVIMSIVIPLVGLIWFQKRAEWHADTAEVSALRSQCHC